jgi:hypothetical protein
MPRAIAIPLLIFLCFGCPSSDEPLDPTPSEPDPPTWLDTPQADWPELLSEVPYEARGEPYEPAWPLWSNGTSKARWLVLPELGAVDTSDPAAWAFPVGTVLFKTFSRDRPIETRALRRLEDGWDYAVWQWREDASEADLLDITYPTPVAGADHTIPAGLECRTCHEANPTRVLGYSRDQLEDVIEADDEASRAVLGLFLGNCVHCHSATSSHPGSLLDLSWMVAFEEIIGIESEGSGSLPGTRVVPGRPEESTLFLALSLESDSPELVQMPPLGVQVLDADGIELLRSWIEDLPAR